MVVRNVVANQPKGREWNPRIAAQEAETALRHAEIVGNVQFGRGGLGLGSDKPTWSRAGPKIRRV